MAVATVSVRAVRRSLVSFIVVVFVVDFVGGAQAVWMVVQEVMVMEMEMQAESR